MVTKLNRTSGILICIVLSFTAYGQPVYDQILADSLSIGDMNYTDAIGKVREVFGQPVKYVEREVPEDESEGIDKLFYFTYDSFKISFAQSLDGIAMNSFDITTSRYKLCFSDIELQIGMNESALERLFPVSYEEYNDRYENRSPKVKSFFINLGKSYESEVYYDAILKLEIVDGEIIRIGASFNPA